MTFKMYLKQTFRPQLALVIFLLIFCNIRVIKVVSQVVEPNNNFYCSDGFCPEWLRENPCTTESAACNTTGFRKFLDPGRCNCCNYCFDYLNENATCSPRSLEKPIEMCGPSLECREDVGQSTATCKPIGIASEKPATQCLALRESYFNNKQGIVEFLSDCDAHGYYSPRQCLPGSMCYCSDRNGNRIFGESLPNEPQDCACARDVARLQEYGFQGTWPHCLPNGDYDELQCVIRSCFCRSDPSKIVYPNEINTLKCFDSEIHTYDNNDYRYYTRECEHHRAELEVQRLEAEMTGSLMIISDLPQCSPDGYYDRVQASQFTLYCADENNNPIENFQARKFTPAAKNMNCYCARARHMLADSATGKPKCCPNGNYRNWQCVGSTCFCVDKFGRQEVFSKSKEGGPIEVGDNAINTLRCVIKNGGDSNTVCNFMDFEE